MDTVRSLAGAVLVALAQAYPCWKLKGAQPMYVDNAGTHDGIERIFLAYGKDGHARVKLNAQGTSFTAPSLPLTPPVVTQLHADAGTCWSARYSQPRQNDAGTFRAAPD